MLRIVCLSDTHNFTEEIAIPDGDVLIHAGDGTVRGTIGEVALFNQWLAALPHKHKILIAGNHDWLFETDNHLARNILDDSICYLQDSFIKINNLKIYGSPWQPRFYDWAFNLDRGAEMAEKWKLIPKDTDILVTHGPPSRILDKTPQGDFAGCEELRKTVENLRPKAHIFGHIHDGYGTTEQFGVKFINASICDESYLPANSPIVFDI
ncbi:MAG: Ser/Thr protein phosphatase family protein [Acidobacteria bacterium]|jgi:Icc-related predicted phosphoesterase|nr:Ser/Thr protein phosphatase family protein [Acidobacteriota bacterium]